MKKSIWLAIIGAAALTGCHTEVMQQREYIPLPRDDSEAMKQATAPAANPEVARPRQEAQPQVQELPTMTQTFSDEGFDDAKYAGKKTSKAGKAEPKTGKAATKGGKAAPKDPKTGRRYYTVQANDNPDRIARKVKVSRTALMEANNLDEESAKKLRIGQKLVIPEGGKAAPKSGKTAPKGGKAAAAQGGESDGRYYTVQANDNPDRIAKKLKVSRIALMEANDLDEEGAKKLQVGQKLVIPEGGKAAPKGGKTATKGGKTGKPAPAVKGRQQQPAVPGRIEVANGYLVKVTEDMSISEFASENNTTVAKLRELNEEIPDELKEGASYVIPKK